MIFATNTQPSNAHQWWWVILCYAVLVLVFCYPVLQGLLITQTDYLHFIPPWDAMKPTDLLRPGNPYLQDQSTEFLPFFLEAKRQFAQGLFPLWNPFIFAGNPLWANTQSALLFPLNWFHYVLAAPIGFTISALMKLFLGCVLTHLFVRRLGINHGPALLAGVAFGFCSFTVFWLNHPHTNVTPLIPLSFYMVERLLDRADASNMLLYALVVALTLIGGHVEIAFLTACACGLYYLMRLWQTQQLQLGTLLKFFWVHVYALLLAAILVFPFIEFLFNTAIWDERGDNVQFSIPTAGIIQLLLGDMFIAEGWDPGNIGYHAFSAYVGVAMLPLVLYAVLQSFQRVLPILLVGLLSLAIAFTIDPIHWLVKQLPLFNHLPLFYFNVLVAFATSVLGAIGLHQCLMRRGDQQHKWVVLLMLVVLVILIGWWWRPGGLMPYLLDVDALISAVQSQVVYVALVLLLIWVVMRWIHLLPAVMVNLLLVGLVYADLWRLGHDWNPTITFEQAVPREQPPSLQFLAEQPGPFRTAGYGKVLSPSTNMLAEVRDVRGYDVPVIDRYHQFFNQALKGQNAFWFYNLKQYDPEILPYLNILNARFLLSMKDLTDLPAHIQKVYEGELHIYQNKQAAGHAYMRYQTVHASSPQAALNQVLAMADDLNQLVVIEGVETTDEEGPADPNHQVHIESIMANQLKLQVDSDQPGWLVISQSHYPGWQATINGAETEIFAANYVLQAIKIPAGSHQVEIKYQPLSFTLGWLVSLLSLIFALWKIRKTK